MKVEDAEEYTQSLGQIVSGSWRQIVLAKRLGVPKALGLNTEQWVNDRLGGYVRQSVAERREAIKELTVEGESNRAIGKILGVDEGTVRNDKSAEFSAAAGNNTKRPEASEDDNAENSAPLDAVAALAADDKIRMTATATAIREREREKIIEALEDVATREAKAVKGVYDVIVIDPPWDMKKIERDVRPNQSEFDYPRMNEEELRHLMVPAADDCHVWVWTTQKFLPMSLRLLDAWDMKYVCTFVWHKPGGFQPVGLPQFNCEFVVYARKGVPKFINTKDLPICFNAPRSAHSEKPEKFYETIRRVTAGRRLDMFNRRQIEGFYGWGNEVG